MLIASVIAIVIGIITSLLLSNSLTKPLIAIKDRSQAIQKGDLDEKSEVSTNIIEIQELSNSINYLGETLSEQEAIRKQYASDISHELRTPLATLKSHVEAMMDGVWEPNQEHLTILKNEINRLSSLVDDLKDSFSVNELGLTLNKTNFNLSDEMEEIITTFLPIFYKEEITISEKIDPEIHVYMDKNRIKQVFYNLLTNAVNYTDGPGEINLTLTKLESNRLWISVKDTGIGIPSDEIPHLFNRFYRMDESRTVKTGGTGLGLSIVQSIVEEHGGEITVKSEYGEGSEFIIQLPLQFEQ